MKKYPPSIKEITQLDNTGGIFFIHSSERYIIKKMKDELRQFTSENPGSEVFFLDMSDGKNILSEAVNTAREIGFFCSKKIVALDLAEKISDKDKDILESYIDNSEPLNHLIIFVTEIDKRTKFFKSLQKMDKIYHVVTPPSAFDLKNFIKSEFEPAVCDERLVEFFIHNGDQDMFYIHSEIEKIKLYAASKGWTRIDYEMVDGVLNGLSEQVIFKIMDLLSERKISKSVKLYREILVTEGDYKVNPLIISMFFKHFKALVKGRILLKDNRWSEFSSYLQRNRLFYLKKDGASIAERYKNITLLKGLKTLSLIELGMKGAEGIRTTETSTAVEQFMINYF